jgi:hypothetical protein
MRQLNPNQCTTEHTEGTESKAFLRALRVLRGKLKTTPSSQTKKPTAKDAKGGKSETEKTATFSLQYLRSSELSSFAPFVSFAVNKKTLPTSLHISNS